MLFILICFYLLCWLYCSVCINMFLFIYVVCVSNIDYVDVFRDLVVLFCGVYVSYVVLFCGVFVKYDVLFCGCFVGYVVM